jgi:prostaglandin reductase 1
VFVGFSEKMKAKVFLYAKKFEGEVNSSNFEFIEEDLAEVGDGQFLVEALWISVDPYTRTLVLNFPTGITMIGRQVAR